MNENPKQCASCGGTLDSIAGAGLCPRCLMAGALIPTDPPSGQRAPTPSVEQVAAAFPHLEVLALIGAGGMGAVFRARQPKLNRLVALKVLPASLAGRDPAFAERFEREGRMLAQLHHPNIVTVYDSGQSGEFFYLLMEHVDGVNLRQAMLASRFTPEQALSIIPRICDALQFAHEEGVLHRDIKPENILLDTRGRVKLVDFGVGKMAGHPEGVEAPPAASATPDPMLTQAGASLGTPQYMAPEQRDRPEGVDARADIYSLGVVFYELLTGELPVGEFPRPSSRCPSDPRLDAIVGQALEKERDRRQRSAGEVRTQLESLATPAGSRASTPPREEPRHNRGRRATAWVTALMVVLGLAALWAQRSASLRHPPEVAAPGFTTREYTPPAGGPFLASFPGGTLELIAVRAYPGSMPAAEGRWWSPSGELSSLPPTLNTETFDAVPPGMRGYQFLVRAANSDPETGFTNGIGLILPPFHMPSDRGIDGDIVCQPADPKADETELKFWIGIGKWQTIAKTTVAGVGVSTSDCDWKWSRQPDGSGVLEVGCTPPHPFPSESRLVAVDTAGREHPAWQTEEVSPPPASGGKVLRRAIFGGTSATVEAERSLTMNQITEFRVQVRRGSAVVFRRVSLRPGHRTTPSLTTPDSPALMAGGPTPTGTGWAPTAGANGTPDPDQIREEASTLMQRGRYDEALERILWYHKHALELDPAQSGVRLSFALSQWLELGRRYPKAMQALEGVRNEGTRTFAAGGGHFDLFMEVGAINSTLGREDETIALFRTLLIRDPGLARQCYPVVEELLVQRGDYALCAQQIRSFQDRFDFLVGSFQRSAGLIDRVPEKDRSVLRRERERSFVREACRLVEILVGTGRKPEAERLRDRAVAILNIPELRSAVESAEGRVSARATPAVPGSPAATPSTSLTPSKDSRHDR